MQRYRWPGFAIQLVGELQRQQKSNAQFCDTLLQAEGISVPTHSCILAALSPSLSQRLSASPSPPPGQKRHLELRAVKAQTLLQLVGLLYSGEVEVKGHAEQNDVLSAARQFGIPDLVEGRRDVGREDGEPQKRSSESCTGRNKRRKMQDAQVQAEMAGRRAAGCPLGKMSSVSTGTQTVSDGEKTAGISLSRLGQTDSPDRRPNFSVTLQPQNITLEIPSISGGAPSDKESTLDRSSDSVTSPTTTSALPNNVMAFPVPVSEDSPAPPDLRSSQQSSVCGDGSGTGLEDEQTSTKTADRSLTADQPSYTNREEVLVEQRGHSTCAHFGRKSLARMKEMQQMTVTTQNSIKVKLVRTKEQVWEVVSTHDTAETLSPPPYLKQPGPVREPETSIVQAAADASPGPPPLPSPSTTLSSQLVYSRCFTPTHNDELETAPPDESDEQIAQLLEDIMMGLNILPDSERDGRKARHLQPGPDGALSATHAAVRAGGCVHYQDFRTERAQSLRAAAQHRSSCLSHGQPDAPHFRSSVASMRQKDGASRRATLLSRSCPYPQVPTAASAIPTAVYPASQEPSSQDIEDVPEVLPQTNVNDSLSPIMDDLRLPRCLSPLELLPKKNQPALVNSTNRGDKIQSQPPLHERRWLTENSGSPQFLLSAISLAPDTSHSCIQMGLKSSQNMGTGAESYTVEQGGAISGQQNAAEVSSGHRKMTRLLRSEQAATADNAAAPRRRKKDPSHLQEAAGSCLVLEDVGFGTKSQINWSVCAVSLSSNNVLSRERLMSLSSANCANKPSTVTECQRKKTRRSRDLSTDWTRIGTRGFLKKIHENPSAACRERLKPMARPAKILDKQGCSVPGQEGGRKMKTKLEENAEAVGEEKSLAATSEQQVVSDFSKEEEGAKKSCKKRRRNGNPEVIPKKKKSVGNAEVDNKSEKIPREVGTPRQARLVNLKEFQKLIQCQHSKITKSKERQNQDTSETAKDLGSEEKTPDIFEPQNKNAIGPSHVVLSVTVDKNHNHIFNGLTAAESKSQKNNTNSCVGEETSLCVDEHQPPFSCSVPGEDEVAPPQRSEAQKVWEAGVSDTAQLTVISDEGLSHSDAPTPPQGDQMPSDLKSNPQTLERFGLLLSDPVALIKNCSHHQDGEEEEEEEVDVDVDVVLCSPLPPSRVGENGPRSMDISPEEEEEEEEEDDDIIDVTGDEAE